MVFYSKIMDSKLVYKITFFIISKLFEFYFTRKNNFIYVEK